MALPNDPLLLMSVVNTKLRDFYPSLEALCDDLNENRAALEAKLACVGYVYDEGRNQFVRKCYWDLTTLCSTAPCAVY